jgi:hypothetical protein
MKIKQPVFGVISIVSGLLLIPFIGNIFASEVFNWSPFDFFITGTLLLTLGITSLWIYKNSKQKKMRWLLIGTIVLIFVVFWIEIAVGIFDSPISGN